MRKNEARKRMLVTLLLSITFFSVTFVHKTNYAQPPENSESIQTKFEPWLWDKLQELEANGTTRLIIIGVSINCTLYGNNLTAAYNFKTQIAALLAQEHNATILYVGKVLSFINIKVRIPEIKKMAVYNFIDGLSDGEAEGSIGLDTGTAATRSNFVVDGLGYSGIGINVSILDTGIDPNHPDFAKNIIWQDIVNGLPNPYDDNGHGTHCAVVASTGQASNGIYRGVAPIVSKLIIGKMSSKWFFSRSRCQSCFGLGGFSGSTGYKL